MSESRELSPATIVEALGLVLVVADDAVAGGLEAVGAGGAAALSDPRLREALLGIAARARRDAAIVAAAVRADDRTFNLEARPLDATRVLVSVNDATEARRRREAIAVAEEDAARAMVASALEPLVHDRASEALASVRAASEALDRGATTGGGGAPAAAATALQDASGRLKALLAAVRLGESSEAHRARAPFDLAASVAAVVALHRPAFAGRAGVGHDASSPRWALGNAAAVEQAFGMFLAWIAQRLDPEHALDNRVAVTVVEAQGRSNVDARIVGHLLPERAVPADDPLRRALGSGSAAFHAIRALVATGGGELARVADPSGQLTYRLSLPLAVADKPARQNAPPRRARVLAIDDEPMLVVAYQRMMRKTHDIVPVVGGAAALELLRTDRMFDVILCDMVMPQVSGIDVYRSVEQTYPELARRFIFLSGGAFTQTARAFLESTGARCLDKPVEVQTLVGVISEALAAKERE